MIEVCGTPAAKGSNRAILRGGRAVFVPGGSNAGRRKLRGWAAACVQAAQAARCEPIGGAVAVWVTFRVERPKSHYNARGEVRPLAPQRPAVRPDLDKLLRATFDALNGLLWADDARIVQVTASKVFAIHGSPGATVRVESLP